MRRAPRQQPPGHMTLLAGLTAVIHKGALAPTPPPEALSEQAAFHLRQRAWVPLPRHPVASANFECATCFHGLAVLSRSLVRLRPA